MRFRALFLFVLIFLATAPAWGACHAIGPTATGTGTGADWNNIAAASSVTIVRGDTYYMEDGSYSALAINAPAVSGTTTFTFRPAWDTGFGDGDHGQGCIPSIVAGWNGPVMGQGQVHISGSPAFSMNTATPWQYAILGGGGRTSLTTGYGINLDSSGCSGTQCYTLMLGFNGGTKANNITVQDVEFTQSNPTGTVNFDQDYGVYDYCNDQTHGSTGCHDITLQDNYHHNSACDFIFTRGVENFTVQYSYFYLNNGGAACHGQDWEDNNSVNIAARYNIFAETRGTGVIVVLCDVCTGPNITTDGYSVYGNVAYTPIGVSGWTSNGTFLCINPTIVCNNFVAYNNTIANQQNTVAGAGSNQVGIGCGDSASCTGTNAAENNIFYNLLTSGGGAVTPVMAMAVEDYNTAIASGAMTGVLTGAHDLVNTSNVDDFTNYNITPPPPSDFTLTKNATADYGTWVTLSSPFNQSCADLGCTSLISRTANRGAYEFNSGTIPAATPTFSPSSGAPPQTVTISTTAGTTICWNTTGAPLPDGLGGCTAGTVYTGPVTVASPETLYAAAGGVGYSPSSVGTATYSAAAAMRGCDMSQTCN